MHTHTHTHIPLTENRFTPTVAPRSLTSPPSTSISTTASAIIPIHACKKNPTTKRSRSSSSSSFTPPPFRKLFCFFLSSLGYNSALTVLGFYRSSRYLLGTSLLPRTYFLRTVHHPHGWMISYWFCGYTVYSSYMDDISPIVVLDFLFQWFWVLIFLMLYHFRSKHVNIVIFNGFFNHFSSLFMFTNMLVSLCHFTWILFCDNDMCKKSIQVISKNS